MARKVTISIPEVLHEKMNEWRNSFNLSKMFQETLAEAINRKEAFQKRLKEDTSVSDIIDRLKREKSLSEKNYFENGIQDGLIWAKTAHYDDLQYAVSWIPKNNPLNDSILGDFFKRVQKKDKMMSLSEGLTNGYFEKYIDGWKDGVSEFWKKIKDQV